MHDQSFRLEKLRMWCRAERVPERGHACVILHETVCAFQDKSWRLELVRELIFWLIDYSWRICMHVRTVPYAWRSSFGHLAVRSSPCPAANPRMHGLTDNEPNPRPVLCWQLRQKSRNLTWRWRLWIFCRFPHQNIEIRTNQHDGIINSGWALYI